MRLKRISPRSVLSFFLFLVFMIAGSMMAPADDKQKKENDKEKEAAPAGRPAQPAHAPSGGASHGGNQGPPSNGGAQPAQHGPPVVEQGSHGVSRPFERPAPPAPNPGASSGTHNNGNPAPQGNGRPMGTPERKPIETIRPDRNNDNGRNDRNDAHSDRNNGRNDHGNGRPLPETIRNDRDNGRNDRNDAHSDRNNDHGNIRPMPETIRNDRDNGRNDRNDAHSDRNNDHGSVRPMPETIRNDRDNGRNNRNDAHSDRNNDHGNVRPMPETIRNDRNNGRNDRDGGRADHNPGRNDRGNAQPEHDRNGDRGIRREAGNPHREFIRHETLVGNHRIATDDRGRLREIRGNDGHGRDMVIRHDLRGGARFETRRTDVRVVGFGRGRGFTERVYINRGPRVYVQRTYIYGGRRYAYAYRSYNYRGVVYYRYAPVYYYRPAFYGWIFRPWGTRVVFRWGWYNDPWYRSYGYYYTPYPAYTTASLWLTDYLLAENLRLAYEARANAVEYEQDPGPPQQQYDSQVTLSPEVKQLIADEVQRQLEAERMAAQQPQSYAAPVQNENMQAQMEEAPPALDPNQRVFIVAGNVDLAGDTGECTVTAGDVLLRTSAQPDENNRVTVNVVSSKRGSCPANTNADIDVGELQEMHNQFRQKMDAGLKSLAEGQGQNGLPRAPDTGTTAGEVPPPQPDAEADRELQNQQRDVERTEQEVQRRPPGM